MQVTETNAEGLKREIQVVLPVQDLNERCDKRLDDIKDDIQIRGFRKGKVPKVHLKKVYGRRLMLEVLQEAVEQSSQQALSDRNERAAVQPEIKLPEDQAEIESVVSGSKDLSYSMSYEIIPQIDLVDFATLELERLVADVEDDDIAKELDEIAQRSMTYEADSEAGAEDGDKLKIDFIGRIDGEEFDGGTAQDIDLIIGQQGFIAGFEDGLKGVKAGEQRDVTATFPEEYPVEDLRGKEAVFEVTVKELGKPKKPAIDDALAETVGMEDLEKLKEAIKQQISQSYAHVARGKVKRQILDLLDEKHAFDLPETLCKSEFESIWAELERNLEKDGKSLEDMDKPENEVREEYQKVAERRVRLGLIIGEIGDRFEIKVEQVELREAIVNHARQYPGQEQHVFEYFEKTPGAVNQLRAPIFEEKVVDLLLSKADITERKVSKDELLKSSEDEESEETGASSAQISTATSGE